MESGGNTNQRSSLIQSYPKLNHKDWAAPKSNFNKKAFVRAVFYS